MEKLKVGIVGATGMVGQRLVLLLNEHPWFEISAIAASGRSEGKRYCDAVDWVQRERMPDAVAKLRVLNAADAQSVVRAADMVFCALGMSGDELRALEERYCRLECPVISNNSAHRGTRDVPMIIPELNPHHAEIIPHQRKRMGTRRGFIAVKSNCSVQSYLPLLYPLRERFGLEAAYITTLQAVSGAGKILERFTDIYDNIIPYIAGEERKSETEPLKLMGTLEGGEIVPDSSVRLYARCVRVGVSDGHTACVNARFLSELDTDEILSIWESFGRLELPSAPERLIRVLREPDRPQPRLDRDEGGGMTITVGMPRLLQPRELSFVALSHNTLRGAAGGAVLLAELLVKMGYIN